MLRMEVVWKEGLGIIKIWLEGSEWFVGGWFFGCV